MSATPAYRMKVQIFDDETGEMLANVDQPLMSGDDDNASNAYRALREFKRNQEAHESTHYPVEQEV